ncbi:MAG: insulinase family protein [Schwartzia sp.]|nr:insulinase family protein [Schwartzia sp. (in: firmicutes)]
MQANDRIHGFLLKETKEVPEIASRCFLFEHEKSGARLFYVKNNDDNKVFSISFRTPPVDDTGAAHIVEHSTLCGSRKFPLKEPFVELVKGSLNTFLNAMTYPDKTMYPVASRNAQDFRNLMDVYLDAVFYPQMYGKPEVLLQEGWHYEIESPDEPLRYSGVVYNEMKGATSSPEDLLETELLRQLYPETAYAFESGGNPEKIPDITQESFVAFHKKYYHPSNSYIYLYGDMDIDGTLAFIDEAYLSKFSRQEMDSALAKQPKFDAMRRVTAEYPVGTEEDTKEKTYLALGMIVCDAGDRLTRAAMSILTHALFMTDAAPVTQALMDAGVGKDVSASLESQIAQPNLSIEVTNAEPGDAERFHQVVMDTIRRLVGEGLDRTLLEASLNYLEFKTRESDFASTPKGLVYNLAVMTHWLYGGDPAEPLFYEQEFKTLREGLDNGLFEDMLRRCVLDNPHKVLITMKPSRTMAAEREAATEKVLAEKKAAMSPREIEAIIRQTARLKELQQTPDAPEMLEKIPLLKLSDIRKDVEKLPLEEKTLGGQKVLFSDLHTNGIAYLSLYFDGASITAEQQHYACLLCDVLGAVDTDEHSYAELTNLANLHTGGLDYNLTAVTKGSTTDDWFVKTIVKARVLVRKLPELGKLLAEILTKSRFSDAKRMRDLVKQTLAGVERQILNAPNRVMSVRLSSYFSPASRFEDGSFLPYYRFLKELDAHFEERATETAEKLSSLLAQMFTKHNLILGVTAEAKDYAAVESALSPMLDALNDKAYPAAPQMTESEVKNEALVTSSRVQYVGKGENYVRLGYKFTGAMRVLETIMRYGYLWTRLRVQGGAYGASAQFARNGLLLFTSYRDPNLAETLKVYDGIPEYLENFTASEREMTKSIIGTISTLDVPLTPQMKGSLAAMLHLRGISQGDRQRERDEVLSANEKAIQALAPLVEACMKKNTYCVFGGEEKAKENGKLFSRVVRAME